MILNTGSRTDIPAFYSDWFYHRISEGFVFVRNPYYPTQVTRYRLEPSVVDCLVFCTKNPAPMLPQLPRLDTFQQFWFVTITPYDTDVEPYVPPVDEVTASFRTLSDYLSRKADFARANPNIGWRYDPIFLSEKYTLDFHLTAFQDMCEKLAGYTSHCVISFIDLYEKTKKNFHGVKPVGTEEQEIITRSFVQIGEKYGIAIRTCNENTQLARFGADVRGCMTQEVIERAIGCTLDMPKKPQARPACACLLSNDIGMYNTCGHGCLYCYANYDRDTVKKNLLQHDPASPFLIGNAFPEDVIHEAKQEKFATGQMKLTY